MLGLQYELVSTAILKIVRVGRCKTAREVDLRLQRWMDERRPVHLEGETR